MSAWVLLTVFYAYCNRHNSPFKTWTTWIPIYVRKCHLSLWSDPCAEPYSNIFAAETQGWGLLQPSWVSRRLQ